MRANRPGRFAAFRPRKLNYELLGNGAPHIHWHLFPRHADDARPQGPVWEDRGFLRAVQAGKFVDPQRATQLKAQLLLLRSRISRSSGDSRSGKLSHPLLTIACMRLCELRGVMREYATRFDAARVSADDAARVVEDAAAIEKMAATVKSLAAARLAGTTLWKRDGDLSAAHHLARTTGTPVGQARDALEAARRLPGLPAIEAAARRGELSAHQVAVITDAAIADPGAEARLLKQARNGSYGELRDECARTKANVTDLEERRRLIHRQRYLRTWADTEGAALLQLRDNPEVVAGIMATLEPIRDELAEDARKQGRRERIDAHAADALAELTRRAESTGSEPKRSRRTKMLVRVDLPRLLGHPATSDEVCEIAGFGPVASSAIRDLLDTEDPFLAAVVTKGKDVVGVAHLGRRPNARQQTALEWLYPTCAVEGCNSLAFLETDHRDDWASTHTTVFELLDRFCGYHHDLKTRENWALVEGRGKRAFVPPDDPRHPRNAHSPPVAA